jgi:hypothetical protein
VAAVGGVLLPEDGNVSGGNVPTVPAEAVRVPTGGVVAGVGLWAVPFAPACACAANAVNVPTSASAAAASPRVAEEIRRRPASR